MEHENAQSTFEKAILSKSNKIDQRGKLIKVGIGQDITILEPVYSEGNGFIFQNGDEQGHHTIKIETELEDFIYWAWDFEHAKKVLAEKMLEHN